MTRIQQLREANGWSRAVLSERSGVSARTIEAWEWGKRKPTSFKQIVAVAKAFGVTSKEILVEPVATEIKGWRAEEPPLNKGMPSPVLYLTTIDMYGSLHIKIAEWYNSWYYLDKPCNNSIKVMAWMPLPPLYK